MGNEFHAASLDRFGRGIQEKADAAWLEPVRAGGAPCADRLGGSTAYRSPKQTTYKPCRIPFAGYRYASGATGSGAQRTLAGVACTPMFGTVWTRRPVYAYHFLCCAFHHLGNLSPPYGCAQVPTASAPSRSRR